MRNGVTICRRDSHSRCDEYDIYHDRFGRSDTDFDDGVEFSIYKARSGGIFRMSDNIDHTVEE